MEQFIRLSFINALSEKDVISRDRKLIGMEIDILIPKLRIAIEPGNWFLHKKSIKRRFDLIICLSKWVYRNFCLTDLSGLLKQKGRDKNECLRIYKSKFL